MIQSRHHFKQGKGMQNLNRSQIFLSFCHLQGLGCVCKVPRKQSFQFDVDIVNLLIILFCLCIEVGGGEQFLKIQFLTRWIKGKHLLQEEIGSLPPPPPNCYIPAKFYDYNNGVQLLIFLFLVLFLLSYLKVKELPTNYHNILVFQIQVVINLQKSQQMFQMTEWLWLCLSV